MNKLKKELNDLGIKCVIIDMYSNGTYIKEMKTVFINQNLSEEEMKLVTLHELKHVLDHSEYTALYDTFVNHSKMENEANNFMVNYIIAENDGQFNYTQLIEEFDIGMGYDVRFVQ